MLAAFFKIGLAGKHEVATGKSISSALQHTLFSKNEVDPTFNEEKGAKLKLRLGNDVVKAYSSILKRKVVFKECLGRVLLMDGFNVLDPTRRWTDKVLIS